MLKLCTRIDRKKSFQRADGCLSTNVTVLRVFPGEQNIGVNEYKYVVLEQSAKTIFNEIEIKIAEGNYA